MTGLRIGWATPWNARSAIAHSASGVADALVAAGHAVTVLRTETGEAAALPSLPAPAASEVLHLDAVSDDALRARLDLVVAHMGDNFRFHGAVIPRLEPLGMLGIFHDAFIANLANGYMHAIGQQRALATLVEQTYPGRGMAEDEPFWLPLDEMVRRRPMLAWLARRCAGGVAHSGHYASHLRRACPGPVEVIPLAYIVPDMPPFPSPWDRITVAAIGHANPNKRLDQIVLAIGSSGRLRRHCRLRVIGEASPAERARLTGLAELLGAEPPEFTGWVDDEDLRWRLRDVDAIACLRNPVLEGASASVITAMASGRPTLVTEHGCYAEIPAGTVLSCRPEEEALDAMRHLEWVLANPAEAAALGTRARAVALERHAPAAYAAALVPLMERAVADRPRREARRHLFSTLGSLGLGPENPAARRVEKVLAGMGLGG